MNRTEKLKEGRDVLIDMTAEEAFSTGKQVTIELVQSVADRILYGQRNAFLYLYGNPWAADGRNLQLSAAQQNLLLGAIRRRAENKADGYDEWRMPLQDVRIPMGTLHKLRGTKGRDYRDAEKWVFDHRDQIMRAIDQAMPGILDAIVRTEQFREASKNAT